jgi:hypothetical protein
MKVRIRREDFTRKRLTIASFLLLLLLSVILIWLNWPIMPILENGPMVEIAPGTILSTVNLTTNLHGWEVFLVIDGEEMEMEKVSSNTTAVYGRRAEISRYRFVVNLTPGEYRYYHFATLGTMREVTNSSEFIVEDRSPEFDPTVHHVPLPDTSDLEGPYDLEVRVDEDTVSEIFLIHSIDDLPAVKVEMEGGNNFYGSSMPDTNGTSTISYYFEIVSSKGETMTYPSSGSAKPFTFRTYEGHGTPQQFVMSTVKQDGGFGPLTEDVNGIFWTYHSLRSLSLLDVEPWLSDQTVRWLRESESREDNPIDRSMLVLSLSYLNATPSNVSSTMSFFADAVNDTVSSADSRITYADTKSLLFVARAHEALNAELPILPPQWISSLLALQNEDGGWAFTKGNSSLSPTFYAVALLSQYDIDVPRKERLAEFVESHSNPDSAFACQPGLASDVRYTYYSVYILRQLDREMKDRIALIVWLRSLLNPDGGFGDRPGWASRTESTNYALSCFSLLGHEPPRAGPEVEHHEFDADGLNIYRAEFEAPGMGLPEEVIDYRSKNGIHLIALKSSMGFASEAHDFASEQGLDNLVLLSPEEYGVRYYFPGYGYLLHISEFIGEVGKPYGHRYFGEGNWPTYEEFKDLGMGPIHDSGGLFFSDFLKPFDMFDIIVSDSLESSDSYDLFAGRVGGQNALLSNPEFRKYIGQVPLIYNSDSHGDSWEMTGRMIGASTIYLARDGSWDSFVEAVRLNRIACVDRRGGGFTIYGRPEIVNYLQENLEEWSWWDRTSPLCYPFVTSGECSQRLLDDPHPHLVIRSGLKIAAAIMDDIPLDLESHRPPEASSATISNLTGIEGTTHTLRIFLERDGVMVAQDFRFEYEKEGEFSSSVWISQVT